MVYYNPEISIIIPAYQSESYLNRCVESITNQSYVDWEAIIIDDGSKDSTFQLASEWRKKDSRIRVFCQENSGVSKTRNRGIREARGNYIMFLDADDELLPQALIEVSNAIKQTDSDMILWGYRCLLNREFLNEYDIIPPIDSGLYEKNNVNKIFWELYNTNLFHNIGTKLYKRVLIERYDIHFEEKYTICEDVLFCLEFLRHIERLYIINKPYYLYKLDVNNNSLSKKYHVNYMENMETLYATIAKFVNTDEDEYVNSYGRSMIGLLKNELKAENKKNSFNRVFDEIINDENKVQKLEQTYLLCGKKNRIIRSILDGDVKKTYKCLLKNFQKEQFINSEVVTFLFMESYRVYRFLFKRKRS